MLPSSFERPGARRPPPRLGPAVGGPPAHGSSGPPLPTLATQLNNGDIAGRAAAPRPPLPLTRACPWACGWPGAGSGRGGVRASSRDGGQAAGSTPPRSSQPERSSPPGSTARKGSGRGARGGGGDAGASQATPPGGHALLPAHPDLLTREVGMCKGRPLWTSRVLDLW